MRVKNYFNGFCVVVKRYWDKYGRDAFVDYFTRDEDDAEQVLSSLSRADGIDFVIVEV